MSTPKFAKTHNLVAFLEKPKESSGFEEIIDFLNAKDMGADSTTPTDSHSTPIISQPSSSKPQKKKSRRKHRNDSGPTEPITDEAHKVLDLEKAKTAQAKEITRLKKRVKQLEKRKKSRPSGLRRLRKVGSSSRVESSNDANLGAQEDASKQESMLEEQEIKFEKVVEEPVDSVATTTKLIPVSAAEVVTTASANVEVPDELTLAQTLIEIKTAKPKPVTTAATTVTSVRPRAKGIIFHDQEEQPKVPLKKKDQVALDEEMVRNLEAQLQAELIEEERLARKKEEEANIALTES
ncbi:hypothetical protein Tco_0897861 [Tanacetum coccineum]